MKWFSWLFFWKKKAVPIHEPPALPPAEPQIVNNSLLSDVFLEAIQETYDEQYKLELELLSDSKLREYIKAAVKKMNKDLTGDSYSFVHIHPHDVGINPRIWSPFAKILVELCKTINLPVENKGSHLYVEKEHVKESFDSLRKQIIDIDERARAMLSVGIYR